MKSFIALLLSYTWLAAAGPVEQPRQFCYGEIGAKTISHLRVRNPNENSLRVVIRAQTFGGFPLGDPVEKEFQPGEKYTVEFGPRDVNDEQIWVLFSIKEFKSKGKWRPYKDKPAMNLEGEMTSEYQQNGVTRPSTQKIIPIVVQLPRHFTDPFQALAKGDHLFLGNPREFAARYVFSTRARSWKYDLAPRTAVDIPMMELKEHLGISRMDETVETTFHGPAAIWGMQSSESDSSITFGSVK